ncbi:flagellar type III secretion system protein FlhB [Plastorhodobacter daqingensis]|uniref:Flagellar type III secretion system protein FlhB n=1 Tax=Plastorhodobacter daqingensis TaxID=1387281 RepID=A0ABW2UF26_9RHOB
MSQEESGEKEHEPSQRKLEQAREKGEVVKSTELTTAAAYLGLLLAGVIAGLATLRQAGDAGLVLLDQADRLAPLFLTQGSAIAGGLLGTVALAMAPLLLLPAVCVFLALVAQRAIVFAPDKLMPKLSRISPLGNAKNKFGRSGLFEFAKSFLKLIIISLVLWIFLLSRLPEIVASLHLAPGPISALFFRLVGAFLSIILVIATLLGAVDYLWQRHEHLRKNRMTRKEMMDEMKNSEGDPHIKQQRRQRGYEIATNRMMADVPKSDVVIVNPTHYAVALKWDRTTPGAPVCVAKGVDEVAARIRAAAAEAGVPLHHDAPTARALHATVRIGEQIRPEHYRAVAAAIRFAETMRQKARKGWQR